MISPELTPEPADCCLQLAPCPLSIPGSVPLVHDEASAGPGAGTGNAVVG
jgi:hypothetical protein